MNQSYNLSPVLREFLEEAEKILGIEIQLVRRPDVPPEGFLVDDYMYGTGKTSSPSRVHSWEHSRTTRSAETVSNS